MLQFNRIPKLSLLGLLLAVAYVALLILLGQQRAMDWGLTEEEMYPHEFLISLKTTTFLTPVPAFTTVACLQNPLISYL